MGHAWPLLSAALVKDLAPSVSDLALRRMALINHGQGGLLARIMATDSGIEI